MSLLVRSGLRAWVRRPAGPVLLLLGLLVATLFASATEGGLAAARDAQEADDALALGSVLGRVWTPGGYTVATDDLRAVQADLAAGTGGRFPLFLERDGLLSQAGSTTSGWRVVGLTDDGLAAFGLAPPAPGSALFDPGPRSGPSGATQLRIQTAPAAEVRVEDVFRGSLTRSVQVAGQYVHDAGDHFTFPVDVGDLTRRLELSLVHDSTADLDLEAVGPDGTVWLDDAGTVLAPQDPFLAIDEPLPGTWTVRVHSKLAQDVAFRLQADHVFDARDAQAVGRLLRGLGWRAVGASLGLTEQARLDLTLVPTDLSMLGPGPDGLLVLPLDRLQAALDLPGQATGLLVPTDADPLDGFPDALADAIASALRPYQEGASATERFDPVQGLVLERTADLAAADRQATLESTRDLLLVVLPAGVAGGLLVAAWAAGLHARRLRPEVQTLASLGQSRRDTLLLGIFHFLPPALLGAVLASALAPFVGVALAAGLGVHGAPLHGPGPLGWGIAATGVLAVAAVASVTLWPAVRGADPRSGRRPARLRPRIVTALAAAATGALLLLLAWLAPPATGLLLGGLAAGAWALALLWGPWLDGPLRAPRVGALGLYRLRSTHASLGQAAAAVALVLAAVFAGLGLSQAASPDPAAESGGYAVIGTTPAYTEDLSRLADATGLDTYLEATSGIEYLMRVAGTGLVPGLDGEVLVYGIDSSFAQRQSYRVSGLYGEREPFRQVTVRDDAAVVSRDVWDALGRPDTVRVEGPIGALDYDIVGVVDTAILPGVYLPKEAMPVHFAQIGGEQRVRLAPSADPASWAAGVGDRLKDGGLALHTDAELVAARLQGQVRAGATLQALGGLAVATAALLGVLVLLRARAERSLADRILFGLGAPGASIGAGLVTEGVLPFLAAVLVSAPVLPLAARLDGLEGLAFPLNPIDASRLAVAALVLSAALVAVATALGLALAWQASRRRGGVGRE